MTSRTLPPRKQPPPPPPRRAITTDSTQRTKNITASLNIRTQLPLRDNVSQTFALILAGLDPEYFSWLLSRPPPPVPGEEYQVQEERIDQGHHHRGIPLQVPARRLPPKPPSPPVSEYQINLQSGTSTYDDNDPEREYSNEYQSDDNADAIEQVGGLYSSGSCIKCYDFSYVDEHAAQFPRQRVVSIPNLANDLTRPFKYETEKARAIFTWLHHNVLYDTQAFFGGTVKPSTPESTLATGLAVCEGFSGLFASLAEHAGLQVHTISGHGKGFGYQPLAPGENVPEFNLNHAWNCVLMDGEWHLIDATWAAGAVDGTSWKQVFNPFWFSCNADEFGKRHWPKDPSLQLIADEDGGPQTWVDYISQPPGPVIYGEFERLGFHIEFLQPASTSIRRGKTSFFSLYKRCEHLSTDEADNYVYVLISPNQSPVPLSLNEEGGWSVSHYISNQTEISLMYVRTFDERDAKGLRIETFQSANKSYFCGALAKWTVD